MALPDHVFLLTGVDVVLATIFCILAERFDLGLDISIFSGYELANSTVDLAVVASDLTHMAGMFTK